MLSTKGCHAAFELINQIKDNKEHVKMKMTIFKNKTNERWYAKVNDSLMNVFISKEAKTNMKVIEKVAKNGQTYAIVDVDFKRGKDNFYYFLVK